MFDADKFDASKILPKSVPLSSLYKFIANYYEVWSLLIKSPWQEYRMHPDIGYFVFWSAQDTSVDFVETYFSTW